MRPGDVRRPDASTPSGCNRLETVATVNLGAAHIAGSSTSIAFDGTRFGVAWRGPDSLRFTLIDAAGVAVPPAGNKIGDGVPSLVFNHTLSRYVVLIAGSNVRLQGLDLKGNPAAPAWEVFSHSVGEAVVAPRLDGHTILYWEGPAASPLKSVALFTDGTFTSHIVDASGSHYLPWLAAHGSGLAAAWENHLVQLSPAGALSSDFGQVINSYNPRFVVTPSGFSVADIPITAPTGVQTQLLDDQGKARGPARIIPVHATRGGFVRRYVALAWTGDRHVLAYVSSAPSPTHGVAAQLLDADMEIVGSAVEIPACAPSGSAIAGEQAIAVGASRIAVAYELFAPGPTPQLTTCVALLRCAP